MAVYLGLGKNALEGADERYQGALLLMGERVGRTALPIEPAHISYADAALVVAISMGAHYFYWATHME